MDVVSGEGTRHHNNTIRWYHLTAQNARHKASSVPLGVPPDGAKVFSLNDIRLYIINLTN